jgi:hypothetical protein
VAWPGDHLRSASHLDILLVRLGCLISIPECRRLAAGVVILTMTFEGLLFGLPKRPDGGPFTVQMAGHGSSDLVHRCGRVPLFICTNVAKNSVDDRSIIDLYSGADREMRPKQEILFGVGSCRAIEVPGLEPSIFPRVKITRECRRLAAALDCIHIIPPSHNVAFAQHAAYCQGWYGDGRGTGGCAASGRLAFTDRSRWGGCESGSR